MSFTKASELEIWFITGSQSLYGDEILAQVAEQSKGVAKIIENYECFPVKLVWKPVVLDSEAIRKIMLEASSDDRCIGLITWMHTFSPAKMWINGLNVLSKPLLHLHTQANLSLPWSTIDMDFMNLNQAAHGDREYGHITARLDLPRKVVVGHASQPEVQFRINNWVRAALGAHEAANLKLARFGDNMRFVAVTDGDKTSFQIAMGTSIESYGVNALVDEMKTISESTVDELIVEYERLYEIAPELSIEGPRHSSLRYQAKIEAALTQFLERGGFKALTTNFEDLGELEQLPGLAIQRLMAKGYGFGGEGDWKTSALLRVVKAMSAGLPGGTSFMEDYTYHFGPGEAKVLGSHMLEVCPTITSKKPRLEIHPLGIGARQDPVRMVFDADPSKGFVLCWTDLGNRLRIITNTINIVPSDEPLPKLPVARAIWKPEPNLAISAESWILAGGSHHTVMSTALNEEVFEDLAEMLGLELIEINKQTTPISIREKLRWNDLYYNLRK